MFNLGVLKFNKDKLLTFLLVLVILTQYRMSFTWYFAQFISMIFVPVIFALLFKGRRLTVPNKIVFAVLGGAALIFIVKNFQVSSCVALLAFWSSFYIKDSLKIKVVDYITTLMSVVMFVSLSAWLIHFNVKELPLYSLLDLSIIGNPGSLENYLFFVNNPTLFMPRFYSIYEEPGGLGVMLSFILAANNYNVKDFRVIVLFFSLIFTYSLAGYIVTVLGICFMKVRSLQAFFQAFFFLLFLTGAVVWFFQDDAMFNQNIVGRLLEFDDQGLDHRNSEELNEFFQAYITSFSSIFGMGPKYAGTHFEGSSYKFFIINYGFFGLFILLMMYVCMAWRYGKNAFRLLLIYALAFLPQYGAFLSWQILLFSASLPAVCSSIKALKPTN